MIISYDYGHGIGQDRGANGYKNEEKVIREYGPVCVNELMRQGHTLVNCTPTSSMTLGQSLAYRVNKSISCSAALHLCFHVNAFKTTNNAMGTEIEVASDTGEKYGQSVLKEICKLGFKNRGIKRPNLYVTGNTKAPAILIEPFFCDSSADVKLYNPNTLGAAIAKGILAVIGGKVTAKAVATPTVKTNQSILQLQQICIKLGVNDHFGNRVVADGIDGPNIQSAKAKLKLLLNNILK